MRKPYHLSDATRASERRKAALYLAAHAAQNLLGDSSDGEGSDSDGEEEVQQLCVVVALLRSARMPFLKQMPRLVIGPRHYSFARIVDQWGHGTQNCEDTFRFDLPELQDLVVALRVPAEFRTLSAKFTGEVTAAVQGCLDAARCLTGACARASPRRRVCLPCCIGGRAPRR